ncbi:MAG: DUF2461 domain-containing protein [Muribaculaceae bacterium]|nr:DUF2461 domain-containing protein [Muribaculaceae bacterium]
MIEILEFLKELSANNNREWFNANKDRYLRIKTKIEAFTQELITLIAEFEPHAEYLTPADCLYRIYRDTRFSTDKTPYKTHIGIYINPRGGKKSEYCGYYIHIEPGNCLVGGGAWFPEAPLLKEYRKEIYDNSDEYIEIIRNPDFEKYYRPYWQEPLKTSPKGFPKDWPHIDLLKPRSFVYAAPISDKQFAAPGLKKRLRELFLILKPYNDFFNFTLEEHPEFAVRTPRQRK